MAQPSPGLEYLEAGAAARHAGQPDSARTAFGQAITACREAGDLTGEARALAGQAQVARDTGNLDWAIHDQMEAVALFRRAGDGPALAHALRHAGEMFLDQSRLAHAAVSIREAMDLYRMAPEAPPLDVANAVRSAALLAEALGEAEEARSFWQDARGRYAACGVEAGVSECDAKLG